MTAEYTEVLRFMSAAAKLKPVLRGFEQKSRYYNIAMTEYAYALGLDKYRRILMELELSRRTMSEADYASSVYSRTSIWARISKLGTNSPRI